MSEGKKKCFSSKGKSNNQIRCISNLYVNSIVFPVPIANLPQATSGFTLLKNALKSAILPPGWTQVPSRDVSSMSPS
uniref:Uncharacterized protein n=1 Tax=Amphimedon queenslandica TaxID=400682 RepID=A0A1X7UUC8_AMPQE